MRKPVIAGNWKMYKTIAEAVTTVGDLIERIEGVSHCEIVVAPPFTSLRAVAACAAGSVVGVASQDVSAEQKQGAYTGEVSAEMVADAGATWCIVGHSERRQYHGETDASVNRKVWAALAAGLTPIVCVGELLEDRDAGRAETVVATQLRGALAGLTAPDTSRTILAYEPVWAIGTGRTATPETAQEMHQFLRRAVAELVGAETAEELRVLYGGSVKPENIAQLMGQADIDGALVGGASLEAESFAKIVKYQ
jgi:triosephosphate isomerase